MGHKRRASARDCFVAYACLAPALIGLFVLTIIPIFGVIGVSLTEWTGLTKPSFIGLKNYHRIVTEDPYFLKSAIVTIKYAVGAVVSGIIYSFAIAMLLNGRIPRRSFWRSIFFIPYIIPAMATCAVWAWLYEVDFGVINYALHSLGLEKLQWLRDESTVIPSLVILAVWGTGNLIVIFLAGLQNVPTTYLEAVEIDGGNAWHKFRHVTIPMMTPIIFFNCLMSIIVYLQVFVPAFALTRGGPNNGSLFMAYLIYREGFMRNSFGHASALSLIMFVFIATITAIIFKTSNRWLYYEGE